MDLRRLDRIPGVASVMTPFPYAVDEDDPVSAAEELMREHGIRHVPVTSGVKIVGVITRRELAAREDEGASGALRVGDACTREPYVTDLHEPLDRVLREMAERQVDAAVVVRNGKLAGIFTLTDACRLLAEILEERFRGPDEAA